MLTSMVLFLFLFIGFYEWKTVFQKADTKTVILHVSILSISLILLMLYSRKVDIPPFSRYIVNVLEAVFKLNS